MKKQNKTNPKNNQHKATQNLLPPPVSQMASLNKRKRGKGHVCAAREHEKYQEPCEIPAKMTKSEKTECKSVSASWELI